MKVVSSGYESWDIVHEDKVVGEIKTFQGFRTRSKSVYVNDKNIGDIKNQREAVQKLEFFFAENKKDIAGVKKQIDELVEDVNAVNHEISVATLKNEIEVLTDRLEKLLSYDLI